MAVARLSREESRAQTRAALLRAARDAFLDRGYDGVSLAEIAEAAGCTTGAVYANFDGKDGLFLAVLDSRSEASLMDQASLTEADAPLGDALRAVGRYLLEEYEEDPRWAALGAEYWARAARHEQFREAAARRHQDLLTRVARLIERMAERHGMELVVPAREIARGGGALSRGVRLERAIGLDDGVEAETFEEMFRAYAQGLMRPATQTRKRTRR